MTLNIYTDDSSPMSTSDVESFTGKIVCNIDGSSYIIDAENATLSSLNDNSLSVASISVTNEKTLQTTKISTTSGVNLTATTATSNTTSSETSKAFFNEGLDQAPKQQQQQSVNPKIHTFRVVSANDATVQLRQENNLFKIQKPILMCFICKLSFGITKSFSLHANTEHGLDLKELEKHLLMQREYSSAIIQRNMDESPQISFLEPVDVDTSAQNQQQQPLISSSTAEEFSGMESQDIDLANTQQSAVISTGTSNINSVSSLSSSSSTSSSTLLSPCCTNSSTLTTTTTTTTTPREMPQIISSPHNEEQQSMNDSTTSSTVSTTATITTPTLSSLSLHKSKTNSCNINETVTSDNITTNTSTSTISVTSSSSCPIAKNVSPTPTTKSATQFSTTPHSSSLSLTTGVDLSTSTGNLATEAICTDSLVNFNKLNNDNSNHNDSIEPQTHDIITTHTHTSLSPKTHHTTPSQQSAAASLNTNMMSDFLQQHLQRLSTERIVADEDSQHKNIDNDNLSWSQPSANTFSTPATAANSSVAQISSLHASLAALNSEQNSSSVKLISKFLQHQLVAAQQQQQHQKQLSSHSLNHVEAFMNQPNVSTSTTTSMHNVCPEHPDYKGIDCKTCEMLDAPQNFKPSPQVTPQRSPTNSGIAAAAAAAAAAAGLGLLTAANKLSMSPNHSLNVNTLPSGLNVPLNTPPLNNPAASFTIGACSDHINGRPLGVECARCEMILNSARLNSNVQMSTRNSCKTLKCPQCNWHYKYQETLEIHMREKHPDGESACGYCLAGQQHPRLARGESYSCGYKPYRCEICNYSTTTKGNLSIHMQSDKHLNNMQELNSSQNMVAAAVAAATGGSVGKLDTTPKMNLTATMGNLTSQQQQQQQHQQQQQQSQLSLGNVSNSGNISSSSCGLSSTSVPTCNVSNVGASSSSNKPKPSFRCDICSYETSVARNLRIHMTSEKHTHNMAVLQNNIKHIQALTFLQQQQQSQQQQQQQQNQGNNFMPEVALADLAYNQALMIQLLHQNAAAAAAQTQGQSPLACGSPASIPTNKLGIKVQANSPPTSSEMPSSPFSPKSNDLSSTDPTTGNMEPPIKPDMWPTTLFSCLICANFNTNNLDELNQHLMIDRSRQTTPSSSSTRSMSPTGNNNPVCSNNSTSGAVYFSDIMVFQNNNYICRLCNYKTNLKANYQLHSKTDKHLQKLNFINHLREGGAANEYKLKYYQQQQQQIGANTVQIKCNCCDFYTNSIQKLSLHTQHMRHETMIMIFQHLNYLVQQQQTTGNCNNEDSPTNQSIETAPISLVDGSTPISSSASTSAATATKPESAISCNKSLLCHLCNFKAYSLLEMIQHVKSIRHLQVEQFVCLQRRSEQLETPSLDDVFKLCSNNTSTTPNTTPTHTSNINISINDNKTASSSSATAACFTNFIESENEDFSNKMFFEQNDESENNTNLDNMGNLTSSADLTQQEDNNSKSLEKTDESANTTPTNIPTLIYKCNSCDFFGQAKQEVEAHIAMTHPNNDSCDIISIPTNPVAIQAFQAAMAAATLAAVSRVSKTPHSLSPTASPSLELTKEDTHDNDDILEPVAVKRERLDIPETEIIPEDSVTTGNEPSTSMEVAGSNESFDQSKPNNGVQCPLCQDYFTEKQALEMHLMTIHSVNKDGLARLLLLVDTSLWQNEELTITNRSQVMAKETPSSSSTKTDLSKISTKPPLSGYELLLCQQCGSGFKHEQQLLQHAQKMQHYTMQKGEYLCLAFNSVRNPCKMHYPTLAAMFNHYNDTHMRLVISERHVYKYRCKQCSLAFKTQEKLATHTLYHTMRDATKCAMCQRNFRSTQALQKHMEQTHNQTNVTSNNLECPSPRTVSPSGSEIERHAPETTRTCASDKFENESNRSTTPGQEMCPSTQSPSLTHNEQQNPQSPATQQQMSTISALINQQQNVNSSELLHHLQMQHQQFQNLPALHNLQQMQQQLPQFAAAAAASGMPINPVEMLNLMQFHHLISLNFMNLAPPLIFGGNATAAASSVSSNTTTPPNLSNNPAAQPPSNMTTPTEISASTSSTANPNITATPTPTLPNVDVSTQILQQQQISPGASNSQLLNNQKRARTRITDDQLKILRAHFDINNSPSEESILEMSQKANLPMKVVKHWFRNTLFKERQRNKDSPYNFNNPPSTTLNLEEYERTGQAKVMPLTDQMQQQQLQIPSRPSSAHSISNISEYSNQQPQQQQLDHKHREDADNLRSQTSSVASSTFPLDVQIKTEPGEDLNSGNTISVDSPGATAMSTFLKQQQQQHQKLRFSNLEQDHDIMMMSDQHMSSTSAQQQQQAAAAATFYNSYETKSESESSDMHSRPHTPNSNTTSNLYASMNDLLSQQLENMPLNQMGPPKKFQINPNPNPCSNINTTTNERSTTHNQIGTTSSGSSVMCGSSTGGITVSSKLFEKHSPSAQYDTNSNSSNSSTTSSGKRANRTRFTDYQIKVLQEFFENNSYPKDSDLEYLSKLLLLSPRVIVVWFQNARQKQRKIYENQPNNSLYESEEKKQNINYACKKCSLVFQRYYELIRHQKNHCFKEENNKKSAKAQIAAAQIAQNLSSEDSNSSMDINSAAAAALLAQHHPVAAVVAGGGVSKSTSSNREFSPIANNANTPPRDQSSSNNNDHQKFSCDKCKLSFNNFDHLREHQLMHLVNPNLRLTTEAHSSATAAAAVAAYGPFGSILQSLQQAAHLQQTVASTAGSQPVAKKRKYSETSSNADDVSSQGGFSLTGGDYDSHAKKYNFLYQYFLQNEGNSELRQQFHNQDSADLNIEFLANYYQQTELKKRSNYEFLFQYYIRNEQQTNANFELADNKPNIEFLLQYYQLCESKKFFQLEASPQRIHDGPLIQGAIDTTQHNINSSNNSSSRPASNGSDRSSSSPGVSGINEESIGGGVVNNMENENSPLQTTYNNNNNHTTRSNGQHCSKNNNNNNNTDLLSSNVEVNNQKNDSLDCTNANKIEEQMDQLDGLQEVKNQTNPIQSNVDNLTTTADSEANAITETPANLGNYYQNLEDFLDATMIENHNQTLTFPTELNELSDNPKQQKSLLTTNTTLTEDTVPTASNSAENNQKQANKRLRTTILPEQLNFLYECYQNESNPSRKMLEEIAKKVSLKKRVVQVWFQNTRAKDKKSRNQQRQHFSNISDDNSNSSSVTNSNLKATIPAGITAIKSTLIGGETSSNDVIRDCNLCQVTQVNIQQHAFTVDHISKVKELLAQTTAAAAASMMQESVDIDDDDDDSLNDCSQKLASNNGEQNIHQQQLALMMMAFQTQNIPNSLTTFNAQDENSVQFEGTEERNANDILSTLPSKNQKKTKRTAIKKKKIPTKKSMAENIANDNELSIFNFNANIAGTAHLNAATEIRPEENYKNDTLGIDSNDENDGNNNVEDIEMTEDDELKTEKTNNIDNQCESITQSNGITKSQIYNYNHIAVMEGK